MTSTLPPQPPLSDSHNIGAMVGEIHNHLVNPDQDLQVCGKHGLGLGDNILLFYRKCLRTTLTGKARR